MKSVPFTRSIFPGDVLRRRVPALALAVMLPLATVTACGNKDAGNALSSFDYQVVHTGDVTSQVQVSGVVGPIRDSVLLTKLQTPVAAVNVKAGDRVAKGDELVRMSTTAVERDAESMRLEFESKSQSGESNVRDAQRKLAQFDEATALGYHSAITAANQQLQTAVMNHENAKAALNAMLAARDDGTAQPLVVQRQALDTARKNLLAKAVDVVEKGIGSAEVEGQAKYDKEIAPFKEKQDAAKKQLERLQHSEQPEPHAKEKRELQKTIDDMQDKIDAVAVPGANVPKKQINAHLSTVAAAGGLVAGLVEMQRQQDMLGKAYDAVDRELGKLARQEAVAFEAVADAQLAVGAAKFQTLQNRDDLVSSLQSGQDALNNLNSQRVIRESRINEQLEEAVVKAPFDGIVTAVNAQVGSPINRGLVTVADDSTLVVTANVSEIDVPRIKKGAKVTFTTLSTGIEEFTGEVTAVSAVPAEPQPGQNTGKPLFPVKIKVTGERDNIRLGGTAKVKINLDSANNVLSVSQDALITTPDGKHLVLVLEDRDDKGGVVAEREVEVGTTGDFDVAITGGDIKEGEVVLTQAKSRRGLVGQHVSFKDGFVDQSELDGSEGDTAK